ncbi:hypothetical protein C1J01_01745 [Nonomuraea aridisoli]|uniref:Uncharacterized protein n=1 Tax=Nonomuraea aridisoli TaxID=2070368 RepID=A0A2W2EK77_9ACTN|nr:hypothetical protein C1J01_01745 [Nonomuraea aridisoli]
MFDDDRRRRRHHVHIHREHGRCSPHTFWRVHSLSPRNFFLPRTRFIDGPGGTMTVTVTREHEVTAFLETENERTWTHTRRLFERRRTDDAFENLNVADVVHQLRKLGLPHLEERHMVFAGHEYTRDISDKKYGNMWYRVFGYRIGYSAWRVLGTCRHVPVARGLVNVPSRVEGWRYWETKRPMFKGRRLPWKK